MPAIQKKSTSSPSPGRSVRRLLVDVARRAEAMGLVDVQPGPAAGPHGDLTVFRHIAKQAEKAGIATATAAALHNVETPPPEELAALLKTMIAALEASPAPAFEWGGLARVFDAEQLASLLNVSLSSLKRYQSGERTTPDPIAARLHFLALLVGDLAGSYNDIGVRRWFQRKRTPLDGRAPAALLAGEWDPDDAGPRRVRELARELVTLSAT
jgi:transcriptional regulator with XRE-family HTH domain